MTKEWIQAPLMDFILQALLMDVRNFLFFGKVVKLIVLDELVSEFQVEVWSLQVSFFGRALIFLLTIDFK